MKILFTLLFALLSYSPVMAQTETPSITMATADSTAYLLPAKVTFGVKAGWSYSNLYGQEIGNIFAHNKTTFKNGFHFGITVEQTLNQWFSLHHQLLFNQKAIGIQLSDSLHGDYTSSLKTNYLELYPFNPSFHFKHLQLRLGPYVGALLQATLNRKDPTGAMFKDHTIFGTADNDESQQKYLQKFDFGLNVGLAYRLGNRLTIDISYVHGFADIFQYANSYTQNATKHDPIKIYHRSFQVSLAFSLTRNKGF